MFYKAGSQLRVRPKGFRAVVYAFDNHESAVKWQVFCPHDHPTRQEAEECSLMRIKELEKS